jgi:hypothetical protein
MAPSVIVNSLIDWRRIRKAPARRRQGVGVPTRRASAKYGIGLHKRTQRSKLARKERGEKL